MIKKSSISLRPGKRFLFVLKKPRVDVLEMEDAFFRHNSSVYMPDRVDMDDKKESQPEDEIVTGLAVIKAVLLRTSAPAFEHQKILLTGHTDSSGGPEINFTISKERANGALALIVNDRETWVQISKNRHKESDIQHILAWSGYDVGKIDGVIGNRTKRGIRGFQSDCGLEPDAVVGEKTWGAFFDQYQSVLAEAMNDEEGLDALSKRTLLNWVFDETHAVGCGELFPKTHVGEDNLKSETNRRIEVLFFDPKTAPQSCVCLDSNCTKEECNVYYPSDRYRRTIVDANKPVPLIYDYGFCRKEETIVLSFRSSVELDANILKVQLLETSLTQPRKEREQLLREHAKQKVDEGGIRKGGVFYEVQDGDDLEAVIKEYGHDRLSAVLQHPENTELLACQKDGDDIETGDYLFIPQIKKKTAILLGDMLSVTKATNDEDEEVFEAVWSIDESGYDPLDCEYWLPETPINISLARVPQHNFDPNKGGEIFLPQFLVIDDGDAILGVSPNPMELVGKTSISELIENTRVTTLMINGRSKNVDPTKKEVFFENSELPFSFIGAEYESSDDEAGENNK